MSQTKEEFMELNEVLNKMYYREGLSVSEKVVYLTKLIRDLKDWGQDLGSLLNKLTAAAILEMEKK